MSLKFLREMASRSLPGEEKYSSQHPPAAIATSLRSRGNSKRKREITTWEITPSSSSSSPSSRMTRKSKKNDDKKRINISKTCSSSTSSSSVIASTVSELECPICMEGMHLPVKTKTCGHKFCFHCIVCLDRCPICRQTLDQANGDFHVDEYLQLSLGIHYHPRTLASREQHFNSLGYAPVETVLQRRRAEYPQPGSVMPSEKMFLNQSTYASATAPKAHLMYSSGGMMKRRAPSLVMLGGSHHHRKQQGGGKGSGEGYTQQGGSNNLPYVVDSPRQAFPRGSEDEEEEEEDSSYSSVRFQGASVRPRPPTAWVHSSNNPLPASISEVAGTEHVPHKSRLQPATSRVGLQSSTNRLARKLDDDDSEEEDNNNKMINDTRRTMKRESHATTLSAVAKKEARAVESQHHSSRRSHQLLPSFDQKVSKLSIPSFPNPPSASSLAVVLSNAASVSNTRMGNNKVFSLKAGGLGESGARRTSKKQLNRFSFGSTHYQETDSLLEQLLPLV